MWKEKENQVKNLIKAQKLVIVEKKTDPIAVANKEAEIKQAEKGKKILPSLLKIINEQEYVEKIMIIAIKMEWELTN